MKFQIGETLFEFEGFEPGDVARLEASVSGFAMSQDELRATYHKDVLISHIKQLGSGRYQGGVFDVNAKAIAEGIVTRHGEGIVVGFSPSGTGAKTELYKRAIYGGVLFSGFGHIILESASRLWAAKQIPDLPIVFQTTDNNEAGKAILLVLVDLLGIATHRIRFTSNDVRVARAFVPAPGLVLGHSINRNYLEFIRTALAKFEGGNSGSMTTYLSRAGLNWRQRRGFGEVELERALKDNGHHVVRSEGMSLSDQICMMNRSSTVSGFIGSQFHLLFLRSAMEPVDILYLCSSRPNSNFLQIDVLFPGKRIYSNIASYGPAFDFGNRSPFLFDPSAVKKKLGQIGMPIMDYDGPTSSDFLFDWALAYFYFKVFREGLIGGNFIKVAEVRIGLMIRKFMRKLTENECMQILNAFAECARRHEFCRNEDVATVEEHLRLKLSDASVNGGAG